MVRSRLFVAALLGCSPVMVAQSFEASVGGGKTEIPAKNANIGTTTVDPTSGALLLKSGFRITLRMTLNSGRFLGHEFGYGYSHTTLESPASTTLAGGLAGQPVITLTTPAQSIGVPAHQGFYDFLVYGVPEGKVVRPFVAGGVQFTAFSQPNNNYNRETKYGINYGGGLKFKVKENWGFRLDARQYNMGKPFNLSNASGRLLMWEFSGSVSFLM
jgi:opacity protein-like surface antigen